MTVLSVNSSTFTTDVIILLRDSLRDTLDDPIVRSGNDKFILTSYPSKPVKYPVITITDTGSRQEGKLGMGSQGTVLRLGIEIRVWARNVKERDTLFDAIYDHLRTNQLSGDDLTNANLHDFSLDNSVNVSEENIQSKVGEFTYLFLCV